MATNCIVTKLKESVNNPNLNVLGFLRLAGVLSSGATNVQREVYVEYKSGTTGTVTITSAYGTIGLVSSATGTDKVYSVTDRVITKWLSNDPDDAFVIQCSNKENIVKLHFGQGFDASQIKFYPLEDVRIQGVTDNVNDMDVSHSTYLLFNSVNTEAFDISRLANNTTLLTFNTSLSNTKGNISAFANKTLLQSLSLNGEYSTIEGDIANFGNTKIPFLRITSGAGKNKTNLYGDLTALPPTIHFLQIRGMATPSVFRWQGTHTGYRIGMEEITIHGEDLDKMLTDQAQLDAYTESTAWMNELKISTSPVTAPTVDASVFTTLKSKGLTTIVIDGVTY